MLASFNDRKWSEILVCLQTSFGQQFIFIMRSLYSALFCFLSGHGAFTDHCHILGFDLNSWVHCMFRRLVNIKMWMC